MDGLRWTSALTIAFFVHLIGLLWFEPVRGTVDRSPALEDSIVVMLGRGSGENVESASVLPGPTRTDEVRSTTRATEVPSDLRQRSVSAAQPSEPAPPPQVSRPMIELEAVDSPAADSVRPLGPADRAATAAPQEEPRVVVPPAAAAEEPDRRVEVASSAPPEVGAPVAEAERPAAVAIASLAEAHSKLDIPVPVSLPRRSDDTGITELSTPAPAPLEPSEVQVPEQRSDLVVQPPPSDPVVPEPEPVEQTPVQEAGEPVLEAPTTTTVLSLEAIEAVAAGEQSRAIEDAQRVQSLAVGEAGETVSRAPQADTLAAAERSDPVNPVQRVQALDVPATREVARALTLDELQAQGGGEGVVARYAGRLKGWLQENMHYPRAARVAGQQGTAVVRFTIDRSGRVLSVRLEQASGHEILDREAMEMIRRAEPFPVMPEEMGGEQLELRVPVAFHIDPGSLNKQIPPIYLE